MALDDPHRPATTRSRLSLGRETLADREARLARLDALLVRTCQRRRDQRRPPAKPDGFTLIELLVVLAVVMILVGMTLGALSDNLRRSAVRDNAGAFVHACDTARQLALLEVGDDSRHFGVRLVDKPDGSGARVQVIVQEDGKVRPYEGADGKPLYDQSLHDSAVVWQGDEDLRSGDTQLEWYFANGSGEVVLVDSGGVATSYVGIGLPTRQVSQVWGLAENTGAPLTLAPATATNPGLSVRSTDNTYRIAVGVYPCGMAYQKSYTEYRGDL